MEHIVQFGITIDDDAIKRHVEAKATDAVVKGLNRSLFRLDYDGKPLAITGDMKDIIDAFLEEHKQEIVDAAADRLADRLMRTKIVKDAVAKTVNDI
jgi:hypothetical protein